jgi:hypothetical protein
MALVSFFGIAFAIGNPTVKEQMNKGPMPVPVQFALICVGLAADLVSGVFMLRGKAWTRILYVGWTLLGFGIGLATSPVKTAMIPGFVLFSVIAFFLFRPKANEFFAPATIPNGPQGT